VTQRKCNLLCRDNIGFGERFAARIWMQQVHRNGRGKTLEWAALQAAYVRIRGEHALAAVRDRPAPERERQLAPAHWRATRDGKILPVQVTSVPDRAERGGEKRPGGKLRIEPRRRQFHAAMHRKAKQCKRRETAAGQESEDLNQRLLNA
jgi:hypothetical protein